MITKVQKRHRHMAVLLLFIQLLGLAVQTIGAPVRDALAVEELGSPRVSDGVTASWAPYAAMANAGTAPRMAPAGQLVISPATAARLQTQLTQAEAILAEAKLRVYQAQSGRGGLGARPEDIAAAQAELDAVRSALRL